MKEGKHKIPLFEEYFTFRKLFWILVFITLPFYILLSIKAGISADEYLHYQQSEKVLRYYQTLGKDKSATEKTYTHLNHYGQFYDNLVTTLERIFRIKNAYAFRHFASAISGWLVLLVTGLFIAKFKNYQAAILGVFLLFLSPRFLGHSLNNLKDIPFALAYIWFFYSLFQYLMNLPKSSNKKLVLLGLSIAFAISIRIGGVILYCYLFFFVVLWLYNIYINDETTVPESLKVLLKLGLVSLLAYILGLLFWPYANENMISNPIHSFKVMGHFPDMIKEIFEGKQYWSDNLPWYFIPKSMVITIPLGVLFGFGAFFIPAKNRQWASKNIFYLFIFLGIFIPIMFIVLNKSNVYSSWRQVIFVYPLIIVISAIGIEKLLGRLKKLYLKMSIIGVIVILFISPIKHIIKNPDLVYCYFNEFTSSIKGAYGQYEMDYYGLGLKEATEKVMPLLIEKHNATGKKVIVASNFPHAINYFKELGFVDFKTVKYYKRGNVDWDFAIFGNRHIHPNQLQKNLWPPENSVITIALEGKPVCAVLERATENDYKGYAEILKGNYPQAIEYLTNAIETDPDSESNYINLAWSYLNTGQLSEAEKVLQSINKIYPGYDEALDLLGKIYILQNKEDKAVSVLTKNIEGNPKYYLSYFKLINIYIQRSDMVNARTLIKQGLSEVPEYRKEFNELANKIKL